MTEEELRALPIAEAAIEAAWETIDRGPDATGAHTIQVARCRRCGFEAFTFADATIEEHMAKCQMRAETA